MTRVETYFQICSWVALEYNPNYDAKLHVRLNIHSKKYIKRDKTVIHAE